MFNPIPVILAHAKTEAAAIGIGVTFVSGIALLGNETTAPKVLAVMVFVSDWNMLWTWEWWLRTIACGLITLFFLWLQKRKFKKILLAQTVLITALQSELRHVDLILATKQTRLDVLEARARK